MQTLHPRSSTRARFLLLGAVFALAACGKTAKLDVSAGSGSDPQLPRPATSFVPTVHIAPRIGWRPDEKPVAARGLQVDAFARGLDHPRWLYVLPNGDVLVAETNAPKRPQDDPGIKGWVMRRVMARAGAAVPSADRITLLRAHAGASPERTVFLSNLRSPFGMALVGEDFYVANTDAVVRFHYRRGDTQIMGEGVKIVELPAGPINHHWTKNLIASPDGGTLYVTVGSNSNVAENGIAAESDRAAIWAINPHDGSHRVYATGLRNPNGLAWEPVTHALWTAVNERDELGSDLVPDYMTAVKEGGFYGWPYSYYGQHVDTRVTPSRSDLVERAIKPDYALGAHTASLGLTYLPAGALSPFTEGMVIGQHGSWNREPRSGYKVVFVSFVGGRPVGLPQDVLTGFLDDKGNARGRPVGVAMEPTGALLVADDVGNMIWRVSAFSSEEHRHEPAPSTH